MWTERGDGSKDAEEIARKRNQDRLLARMDADMRRDRVRRRVRQDPIERYLEDGGDPARVFVPMGVFLIVMLAVAGIAWAIVAGVHEDREFQRACDARGGWVERDVGGHWETVPVVRTNANGKTTVTTEQQYRSGPTYCVVGGQRVSQQ